MSRAYCACGFVPAEDEHECRWEKLVDEYFEAMKRYDTELMEKIQRQLNSMEAERG